MQTEVRNHVDTLLAGREAEADLSEFVTGCFKSLLPYLATKGWTDAWTTAVKKSFRYSALPGHIVREPFVLCLVGTPRKTLRV